jgi:hypothetical protein
MILWLLPSSRFNSRVHQNRQLDWGASRRTHSFTFKFNNLNCGPLALFGFPDGYILKTNANIRWDLQAEFPTGNVNYKSDYRCLGEWSAGTHNQVI